MKPAMSARQLDAKATARFQSSLGGTKKPTSARMPKTIAAIRSSSAFRLNVSARTGIMAAPPLPAPEALPDAPAASGKLGNWEGKKGRMVPPHDQGNHLAQPGGSNPRAGRKRGEECPHPPVEPGAGGVARQRISRRRPDPRHWRAADRDRRTNRATARGR